MMIRKRNTAFWWNCAVLVLLLAAPGRVSADYLATLFDNQEKWPVHWPWADEGPERLIAQQFSTGPHNNVFSTSVAIRRNGSPSGELRFEIWDQNEVGLPGDFVASLDSIDASSLPTEPGLVPLDGVVTGLSPHTPYYLVLDAADAFFTRRDTIRFGAVSVFPGTRGADELLLEGPQNKLPCGSQTKWCTLLEVLGPSPSGETEGWWQISITTVSQLVGDFDTDGWLTANDIDMLNTEVVAGTNNLAMDLTGDAIVDNADLTQWLSDAAIQNGLSQSYLFGDSNLDGSVNATDLNNLALNWQQGDEPMWSGGDFNADGRVNASDLNALALNWQRSIPMSAAATLPVPEPSSFILVTIALAILGRRPT